MDVRVYRENRARVSESELSKHRGKWVAFSEDGRQIIASNEDLVELDKLVVDAGEDPEHVALEWIEGTDVYLGASELNG